MSEAMNGIRIVTLMNRKGGAGKSTICRALASAAVARGESVTIFDTDVSKSCWKWMQRGKESGNWSGLIEVIATTDVGQVLGVIEQIYDKPDQEHLILCDTFGGGSEGQDELTLSSHFVAVPMMVSKGDFEETRETLDWHGKLKERAADPSQMPPIGVVMNRVSQRLTEPEKAVILEAFEQFPMMTAALQLRSAYVKMDSEGLLGMIAMAQQTRALGYHIEKALTESTELLDAIDSAIRGDEPAHIEG